MIHGLFNPASCYFNPISELRINILPSSARLGNKELDDTTQRGWFKDAWSLHVCRLVSFPPLVDMTAAKSGKFLSLIFRLKIRLIFQSEKSRDQPDHQMDAVWNWDGTKSCTTVSATKSWKILHNQLKRLKWKSIAAVEHTLIYAAAPPLGSHVGAMSCLLFV